jgi:hypothetical protein
MQDSSSSSSDSAKEEKNKVNYRATSSRLAQNETENVQEKKAYKDKIPMNPLYLRQTRPVLEEEQIDILRKKHEWDRSVYCKDFGKHVGAQEDSKKLSKILETRKLTRDI